MEAGGKACRGCGSCGSGLALRGDRDRSRFATAEQALAGGGELVENQSRKQSRQCGWDRDGWGGMETLSN